MYKAVFINGTVGAGKTTTACALSDLLSESRSPHAVIDLDQIRLLFPPPPGDPFQHEVELANLRALATNYRAAGAVRLILAGVLEETREVPRYLGALGVPCLLICRLTVDADIARTRLTVRHADDERGLAWHLNRTAELAGVLARADLDDVTLDTSRRTPHAVARAIQRRAGWAPSSA